MCHSAYFANCLYFTVMHDFYCQFGRTKIFVKQMPEGFGLVCHRAIRTICEVVGIKDLHAKVEGSTNLQHIVKAFFIGLLKQVQLIFSNWILINKYIFVKKTHQEMANEKGLHVVELRKECSYYPKVIATPPKCRSSSEIKSDELTDYAQVF